MNINKESYKKYAESHAKKSPLFKNCLMAFISGGLICAGGEGLFKLYNNALGFDEDSAGLLVGVTLIFIAAVLTAVGVFDNIARHAGAGTLVPITGFANSVVSQSIDARAEGFVAGMGSKIFTVAGPVILYGTLAGAIYGVIYYFIK
jgi:stage V sporulation protein AC